MLNPVFKSRYPLLFGVDVLCGLVVPVVRFVVLAAVAQHQQAVAVVVVAAAALLFLGELFQPPQSQNKERH